MQTSVSNAPIGFFDSGIGGLSVWRAVHRLLPHESTYYIADNAHCPYGPRDAEEICALARCHTEKLLAVGCKMIVVACNTATAAAIDCLRATYPDTPFIGMEPAIKPAARESKTGVIGVLATEGTFNGRLYRETARRFAGDVRIIMHVTNGWVACVESGAADAPETRERIARDIAPILAEGADHLVLGCTHFPFLRAHIAAIAGTGVTILDPAPAVARRVRDILTWRGTLASEDNIANATFTATGDDTVLRRMTATLDV